MRPSALSTQSICSAFVVLAAIFITTVAADNTQRKLDLTPVTKWLARMKGIKSVEATFVQQRYLRTLRNPLSNSGRLWIRYPDDFRWELGEPVSTIAIRHQDVLTILQPKKKKAQLTSLKIEEGENAAKAPGAIHSLSKTFPRSMEELQKHFAILDLQKQPDVYELTLKPTDKILSASMRKVTFFIDANKFFLHGFEIELRDKLKMRTTFTSLKFNQKIAAELWKPDLEGYKIKDKS